MQTPTTEADIRFTVYRLRILTAQPHQTAADMDLIVSLKERLFLLEQYAERDLAIA